MKKLEIPKNCKQTIIDRWEAGDWEVPDLKSKTGCATINRLTASHVQMSRPPFNQSDHQAVRFIVERNLLYEVVDDSNPEAPPEALGVRCLQCGVLFIDMHGDDKAMFHHENCPVPTVLAMLQYGLGIVIPDPADLTHATANFKAVLAADAKGQWSKIPVHVNFIGVTPYSSMHFNDGTWYHHEKGGEDKLRFTAVLKYLQSNEDEWELYTAGECDDLPGDYEYRGVYSRREDCPTCGQNSATPNVRYCDECTPKPGKFQPPGKREA